MKKVLTVGEIIVIVILALAPVFGNFPYRFNIFLSYEGAYRLYTGQMPYRDFGMPVGYMFWVIPTLFFKLFGPYMVSLVKAQVFINIIAGLSFRSILKSLGVPEGIRFIAVLLFVLSYSFMNFWPWYNHTVILYELIGLSLLLQFIFGEELRFRYLWLAASGMFIFFSFFTKQDGGAMAFLIGAVLVAYNSWKEKDWKQAPVWLLSVVATGVLAILPLTEYRFGYWFNHGQPPHTARVSFNDIAEDFFTVNSQWIKFYVFIIVLLLLAHVKSIKALLTNKNKMIFTLLTLGILAEAAIFQTTSYIPGDNNIFFHSFALAFILALLAPFLPINFSSGKTVLVLCAGLMLWWSQMYWKYISKYVLRPETPITNTDGFVTKKTYLRLPEDTTDVPMHLWKPVPNMPSFKGMLLPGATVEGIERLMKMDLVKNSKKNLKVLNMTELTPLAHEMKYDLEKSPDYPLWYHLGVGMFQKENDMFTSRIKNSYYDLVLFENITYLNNFYPFQVREALLKYYDRVDVFTAPRKPSIQAWVEVYVRKKQAIANK
jgi:hypothetical protein